MQPTALLLGMLCASQAAAMAEGGPLGYLVINVLEAAGHDSEDAVVWDPDFKQGYARGEGLAPHTYGHCAS